MISWVRNLSIFCDYLKFTIFYFVHQKIRKIFQRSPKLYAEFWKTFWTLFRFLIFRHKIHQLWYDNIQEYGAKTMLFRAAFFWLILVVFWSCREKIEKKKCDFFFSFFPWNFFFSSHRNFCRHSLWLWETSSQKNT